MTRSVKEWIGKHDNEAVPPRVRLRVFERSCGECRECTRKLMFGKWQVDHIRALANGGEHRESNLQSLCIECHARKTKIDVAAKAKTARIRKREAGIKRPRTIRQWRRFNGEIVTAPRERT